MHTKTQSSQDSCMLRVHRSPCTIISAHSFPQKRHARSHPTCPHAHTPSLPTDCMLSYAWSHLQPHLSNSSLPQTLGPASPLYTLLSLFCTFLTHTALHIHDSHTPILGSVHRLTHISTQIYTHICIHTCTRHSYPTVPGPPASIAEGCTDRWAR